MLKRIYADNFRALVNFEFQPGAMSLLVGGNGTGKTSVYDVLGKIRDLVILGTPVADLFGHSRSVFDNRDFQRFELDIELEGGRYRYALEVEHPAPQLKPFIRSEVVTLDGTPLYRLAEGEVQLLDGTGQGPTFPFQPERSFLQNIDSQGSKRMARLSNFKSFFEGVWIIQPNPFGMDLFSRNDHSFLHRYGANFASFFRFLNDERPAVRAELHSRLAEAIPGFRTFAFQQWGDQKLLRANLDLGGVEGHFDIGQLSEGQRVLAVLYGALLGLWSHRGVVCFDEPDNFVALPEIQPFLQLLRDTVADRGGQALVISHHPEVIDYLALGDVWVFDRAAGPARVRPLEADRLPVEGGLKLSELIARGL